MIIANKARIHRTRTTTMAVKVVMGTEAVRG